MKRLKRFDIIAILAAFGIIGWIITDYFGGMIIFLLSYGLIIIPIVIIYLTSVIELIISIIKKGIKPNKIKLYAHLIVILFIVTNNLVNSDLFKSNSNCNLER